MTSLELLNPWMVWGAAALAVPVLIHLMTRHTPRTIEFPTLRFLSRALARQSRLMRFRHLVLLLLRALLLCLLIAAFAKPVLKLPFQKLMLTKGQTSVLLAMDVSMSMDYTGSGATPLSRAKAEAVRILQSLRDGDRANVIFVSSSLRSAAPEMTRDLNVLQEDVQAATATKEDADFNAAIEQAADLFGRSSARGVQKELYLISDFQRTNWAPVRLNGLPPDINLYLVDVDTELKRNAALTAVRTRPSSPRVGDTVEISCEVANYSEEPREIPVDLELKDEARTLQRVLVSAFGSATATFRVRLRRVGDHEAVIRIPPDHLKADDVRYAVLRARKGLTVYVLTDEDPGNDATSAFYLARALDPKFGANRSRLPGRDSSMSSLNVTVLAGKDAERRDLHAADVVFISNVNFVSDDLARKIVAYMETGGSVVYFIGGGTVETQLALLDRVSTSGPITPYTVTDLLDVKGMGRGYVTWSDARFDSPLLKLFRDPEQGDLSKLRFYKFRLIVDTHRRADVLLRYEDRTIAVASRRVGEGNFILCNFSPHPQFTDMIKREVFPPLLHEMVKGLLSEDATQQDFRTGHVASAAMNDARVTPKLSFVNPKGEPVDARWDRVGESISILFENTALPGFYRARSDGRQSAVAAVNVSPDESDLRELDGRDLAMKQQMERRSYSVRADLDPSHVERLRRGRELWHLFLIAAFIVALGEQAVAYALRTR